MSDNDTDLEFRKRADAFIQLANEQTDHASVEQTGFSLLYAAARFNSFLVYTTVNSAEEMAAQRQKAIEYFSDQYVRMLTENIDDHVENFDKYRAMSMSG